MVPKHSIDPDTLQISFRAVLFRMVPKHQGFSHNFIISFRAVLFRMVPKPSSEIIGS